MKMPVDFFIEVTTRTKHSHWSWHNLFGREITENMLYKITCRLPTLFPLPVAIETPEARARVGTGIVHVAVQSERNRTTVRRDCCRHNGTWKKLCRKTRQKLIQNVTPPRNKMRKTRRISTTAIKHFSRPTWYYQFSHSILFNIWIKSW